MISCPLPHRSGLFWVEAGNETTQGNAMSNAINKWQGPLQKYDIIRDLREGERYVSLRDLAREITKGWSDWPAIQDEEMASLIELNCADDRIIKARSLSYRMRSIKGRVLGGLSLHQAKRGSGGVQWLVKKS